MIKTYQKGEHKGGFIGTRVAVSVDGKVIQKYFSVRNYKNNNLNKDTLLKDAHFFHNELIMKKNLARSSYEKASKELRRTTSPFSTGVKGIKFTLAYGNSYFYVQGSTNNIGFHKHFNINSLGYDFAWFKAFEFLQKNKDYSIFDTIYKKKPAKEMLLIAFRHLFFIKKKKLKVTSISAHINDPLLRSWFMQLLRQYESNKDFKEQVRTYLEDNKIFDNDLYELAQ